MNTTIAKTKKVFPTWQTVKVDIGFRSDAECESVWVKVRDWASKMLDKLSLMVAGRVTEVDLVLVSVAELGYPDGAARKDICYKAQSLGLSLCFPKTVQQLDMNFPDVEWHHEWFVIAIRSSTDVCGRISLRGSICPDEWEFLGVHRDRFDCEDREFVWRGHDRFLFCRYKE